MLPEIIKTLFWHEDGRQKSNALALVQQITNCTMWRTISTKARALYVPEICIGQTGWQIISRHKETWDNEGISVSE
jgi:hypothetical protein